MEGQRGGKQFEFWFDISCPYAYIASTQVEALARRTNSTIIAKPVLLGGLFQANNVKASSFVQTLNPTKAKYTSLDLKRYVAHRNVKLVFPSGHPISTVKAMRCILCFPEDKFLAIAHRFYEAYWIDGIDLSTDDGILQVLRKAGAQHPKEILHRSQEEHIKDELKRRTDEGISRGLFGVPTFFVGKEMIYGQDRLEQLEGILSGRSLAPLPITEYRAKLPSNYIRSHYPVTFYFDYSSPYTYVAATRIEKYFDTNLLTWKPVLLGAIFKEVGTHNTPMATMSEAKRNYNTMDLNRQVKDAGIQLQWPSNFPLRTVLPLRVTLLVQRDDRNRAKHEKKARAFIHRVFHACWVDNVDPSKPENIQAICDELGLNGRDLIERAGGEEAKRLLMKTTNDAIARGVFGAPSFIVNDHVPLTTTTTTTPTTPATPATTSEEEEDVSSSSEPALFWGNDRLEAVVLASRGNNKPLLRGDVMSSL